MGAVLGIEGVEVGLMLEVVGVALAVLNHIVGNHVVGILGDLQGPAVLGEDFTGDLQDFGMRRGGGGDADGLVVTLLAAAACEQTEAQHAGQYQSNCLFHNEYTPFLIWRTDGHFRPKRARSAPDLQ